MTAQLYINGKMLDVNTGEALTLNVKSNLLNDISKWTASTSYTFKIPTTTRNMAIMEQAGVLQSSTEYPYLLHAFDYVLDGVTIIRNGAAAVHSITPDAIELTVTFGLAAFDALKEATLKELQDRGEFIDFQEYNTPHPYELAKTKDLLYVGLDMAVYEDKVVEEWTSKVTQETPECNSEPQVVVTFAGSRTNPTGGIRCLHPSVKASFILNKLQRQYGIRLNFPPVATEYINELVIPLVSKKANEGTWADTKFEAEIPSGVTTRQIPLSLSVERWGSLFNESGATATTLTVKKDTAVQVAIEYDYDIDLNKLTPVGRGTRGDNYNYSRAFLINLRVTSGGEETFYTAGANTGKFIIVPNGWKGTARKHIKATGKIDLKAGDTLSAMYICPTPILTRDTAGTLQGGTVSISYTDGEEVPFDSYYPIMKNLPDIKAIDFLKFLCAVTGTFPLQMKPKDTGINFATYDTLADNMPDAVDWSAKLHSPTADSRPDELTFAPSDWCRHNYYKWKDDDTVIGEYDADLELPNETLTTERTVVTFPFAATDGSNIPCYTFADDGTFSYKACKDRVLHMVKGSGGEAKGVFDIYMTNIIAEKYGVLQNALQNAKVIKANIRLTPYDIAELDESRPIYLKQYGSFFALLELRYSGKETTECTLLRLIK